MLIIKYAQWRLKYWQALFTMKKRKLGCVLTYSFMITLAGSAIAQTGQVPDPAAVIRGSEVYTNNCLSCHKKEGVGENIPLGVRAPNYLVAMPLDESSHAWHHGDEQLIKTIKKGNQRMPSFNNVLSEHELEDVLAYVKSLWSNRIIACQGPKHMSCM